MSSWVKALIVLVLVVPMTAYVAGSLVSTSAREPADRGPVIVHDPPSPEQSEQHERPAEPEAPDDGGTRSDDNEARVVTPQPTPVDDDDGEDDDGREGDDDESGTGDDTDDGDD